MVKSTIVPAELIEAAKEGNEKRCEQLLNRGADVNGTDMVSREDVFIISHVNPMKRYSDMDV